MIHNSLCLILMESWPRVGAVQSWAAFRTPWLVNFRRVFWRRKSRAFREPDFLESITPEILKVSRGSFSWKCSKSYVDFKNALITSVNAFGFEDKSVGPCCMNFCLLWQEHMWSSVNVLKGGPNVSDATKRHDTQLTLFDINGKLAYNFCCAELSSVYDPLTHQLANGGLKQDHSGVQGTTFFGFNNSGYIEGMKVIFFFKMLQILCRFKKCNNNLRKWFWFWRNMRWILFRESRVLVTSRHFVTRRSQHFTSELETWYTTHFVWY